MFCAIGLVFTIDISEMWIANEAQKMEKHEIES
jgi:hypothetical protein